MQKQAKIFHFKKMLDFERVNDYYRNRSLTDEKNKEIFQ